MNNLMFMVGIALCCTAGLTFAIGGTVFLIRLAWRRGETTCVAYLILFWVGLLLAVIGLLCGGTWV